MAAAPKPQRQALTTLSGVPFIAPKDILKGEKAKIHLIINHPDVAQLLEECEKAEENRQAQLQITSLVDEITKLTDENPQFNHKDHISSTLESAQPQPETPIAEKMISGAESADYLKIRPMSADEIDMEFAPQNTIECTREELEEEHLKIAQRLRTATQTYSLNNVEINFCSDIVEWLKTLTPEQKQNELLQLEESTRAKIVMFLAEVIQRKRMTRDYVIIGRTYVKAVIYDTQE